MENPSQNQSIPQACETSASHNLWENLFLRRWREIFTQGVVITYKEGQHLFYQGHVPTGVIIPLSGKIALIDPDLNTTQDEDEIIPLFCPLGADLIVCHLPYSKDALAKTDSSILFIGKNDLRAQ
jgi:hypothetical protein